MKKILLSRTNVAIMVLGVLLSASLFSLGVCIDAVLKNKDIVENLYKKVEESEKLVRTLLEERDLLRGELTSLNGVLANMTNDNEILQKEINKLRATLAATEAPHTSSGHEEKISSFTTYIYFDTNSYKIKESGVKEIRKAVNYMKLHGQRVKIYVSGHADKTGAETYNLKLSKERAEQVFFRLAGLAGGITNACDVTINGFGSGPNGDDVSGKRVVKLVLEPCK